MPRPVVHRRVRWIVWFTITYSVVEAVVAITAGAIASSASAWTASLRCRSPPAARREQLMRVRAEATIRTPVTLMSVTCTAYPTTRSGPASSL